MTIATGEPLLASDMLNLIFFPKGAILMYDGTSWQDNVSLKGWYQCAGQDTPYGKTPDLRNKFVMGYESGGRTGGNNSLTLATANLPAHNHSLNNMSLGGLSMTQSGGHMHSGTGTTNSGSGGHTHSISGSTSNTSKDLTGTFAGGEITQASMAMSGIISASSGTGYMGFREQDSDNYCYVINANHSHNITGSTGSGEGTHSHDVNVNIPESGSHAHAITGGTISGSVGNTGSGTAFDNRPSYYALIYIIKMTVAGS